MSLPMPAFGDPSAPSFDPAKPRGLKHYFSDLQYLFSTSGIVTASKQKCYAIRYVDNDTADLWESLPQFLDNFSTFDNFKDAVFELYPSANDNYWYTLANLELLIENRLHIGMNTLEDLSDYHTHFITTSRFLISKQRLSDLEQKRMYPRAFPPSLWTKISTRLALKFPDHYPDNPHAISDVYAAAIFILRALHSVYSHTSSPILSQPSPSSTNVNLDDFRTIFAAFTKSIIQEIHNTSQPSSTSLIRPSKKPRVFKCKFCGENHFIRHCTLVDDYMHSGKVIRNSDSKVVLPTGAYIPEDIPGRFLKEKFDEWYRRHPGQSRTLYQSPPTVLQSVFAPAFVTSSPNLSDTQYIDNIDSRIAEIEQEIARLRHQVPDVASNVAVMPSIAQSNSKKYYSVFASQFVATHPRTPIYPSSIDLPAQKCISSMYSSPAPSTSSPAPQTSHIDRLSSPPSSITPSSVILKSNTFIVKLKPPKSLPLFYRRSFTTRTCRTSDKHIFSRFCTSPPSLVGFHALRRPATRRFHPNIAYSDYFIPRRRRPRPRRPG